MNNWFLGTIELSKSYNCQIVGLVGILKIRPRDQQLYNKDNTVMEDDKPLQDYGISIVTAKAQAPAQLGLAIRTETGEFEALEITPYSSPPDLPDVMKNQEAANGQEQVA